MWELSINLSDSKMETSKKIYLKLKEFCLNLGGLVTTYERCEKISILVSAENCDENRFKHFITNLISDVICEDYKLEYLKQNLNLPSLDQISKNAFLQALLSFDKESDKYIVQKILKLESSIDVDAFYMFKLTSLKDKWKDLVQIANDNRAYLSSNETLVELLKFLVDNLEFKNDTINITQEDDKIVFYDINFNKIKQSDVGEKDIDSSIISDLISFAPKYVNIYSGHKFNGQVIKLLKQIFDKRINFLNIENLEKQQ